jgi:hypothetical protein
LNALILNSAEFDAAVHPAVILTERNERHLLLGWNAPLAGGYHIVAKVVAQAIRRLQGAA